MFVKKVAPDNVENIKVAVDTKVVDFLFLKGLVKSKGECKRLIKQSAIKIDDSPITDINYEIKPKNECDYQNR